MGILILCRAGEILRLKKDVLDRFSIGSPERVLANGMADHGLIVADKSTTGDPRDGVAGVKLSMDVRWQVYIVTGISLELVGILWFLTSLCWS